MWTESKIVGVVGKLQRVVGGFCFVLNGMMSFKHKASYFLAGGLKSYCHCLITIRRRAVHPWKDEDSFWFDYMWLVHLLFVTRSFWFVGTADYCNTIFSLCIWKTRRFFPRIEYLYGCRVFALEQVYEVGNLDYDQFETRRAVMLPIQSPTTSSSASLPSTTSCERARLPCSIRDLSFASRRNLRRWVIFALCQRFFTAFSERPGMNWEISVHLFPIRHCSLKRILSSSVVHGVFFKLGSKKLT